MIRPIIGVFGSSFNPVTLGHLDIIQQAWPLFDKILLVPNLVHSFGKPMIAIEHRLKMLALFKASWFNDDTKVEISNLEAQIQLNQEKNKPIYTFDVLQTLTLNYQKMGFPCEIQFIMGPDNAQPETWQRFYRYKDIEKNWKLFVAKERVSIHSTQVRDIIFLHANNIPYLTEQLVPLVGLQVAMYIIENQLYFNK